MARGHGRAFHQRFFHNRSASIIAYLSAFLNTDSPRLKHILTFGPGIARCPDQETAGRGPLKEGGTISLKHSMERCCPPRKAPENTDVKGPGGFLQNRRGLLTAYSRRSTSGICTSGINSRLTIVSISSSRAHSSAENRLVTRLITSTR